MPVVEYMKAANGSYYLDYHNQYWCLSKRIVGNILDPFDGDPFSNGTILGNAIARLSLAMREIEETYEFYDADFQAEFSGWINEELNKKKVEIPGGIISHLKIFLQKEYPKLSRQPIHRDVHQYNLLFEGHNLVGYLDFDLAQKNARVWDIVYFACSILHDCYMSNEKLEMGYQIYHGILSGYNELLQLDKDELDAIPSLMLFDGVLFTAYFVSTNDLALAEASRLFSIWLYENLDRFLPTT